MPGIFGQTNKGPVTDVDTTPTSTLGNRRVEQDTEGIKEYVYHQYSSNADASTAVGTVVTVEDADAHIVTGTIAEGLGANFVAGVALAIVAAGEYAWFQVSGYNSAVLTNGDDDIAAGDSLIAAGNGVVDSVAAGTAPTYRPLGYAAAADVDGANTVATILAL